MLPRGSQKCFEAAKIDAIAATELLVAANSLKLHCGYRGNSMRSGAFLTLQTVSQAKKLRFCCFITSSTVDKGRSNALFISCRQTLPFCQQRQTVCQQQFLDSTAQAGRLSLKLQLSADRDCFVAGKRSLLAEREMEL
jgi:hypothetical protein